MISFLKEEENKYISLKKEKDNIYNSIYIIDQSAVILIILIDGYSSLNGKIIYGSPNFQSIFMYSLKELLRVSVDDLLPNCIQAFHKELMML